MQTARPIKPSPLFANWNIPYCHTCKQDYHDTYKCGYTIPCMICWNFGYRGRQILTHCAFACRYKCGCMSVNP